MTLPMIFESVESVWALSLLSVIVLACLIRAALRNRQWHGIGAFLNDEDGASYTLPYIMTLPFTLLIFCVALQGSLILIAKIGTMHAAFGAARAAVVWQGAQWDSSSESRKHVDYYANRAAAVGMVPFAAGVKQDQVNRLMLVNPPSDAGINLIAKAPLYELSYLGLAGIAQSQPTSQVIRNPNSKAPSNYIQQKVLVAATLTKATVQHSSDITQFNRPVEVQVTYTMPLQVPLGAPVFAKFGILSSAGNFYARQITTTVTLPSEAAITRTSRLEVPYVPHKI